MIITKNDENKSVNTISFENEDIIITDPCYIMRDENDWETCEHGLNMKVLGFESDKYLIHKTIIGYQAFICRKTTGQLIGDFYIDTGLIGIFRLKDILKYNPNYNYQKEIKHAMLIKNFTGYITINEVDIHKNICKECNDDIVDYEDCQECQYYKNRWIVGKVARIIGEGNINFYSVDDFSTED